MEIFTILLSSLLAIVSPVGIVADQLAENLIRDRLYSVDSLDIRIDNAPNFQILGGRVERVRLAGRGVYPIPELRIDTLDVETDPIDVDLPALRSGDLVLDEPVRLAARLVLTPDDINELLRSEPVQERLDDLRFSLPIGRSRIRNRYSLTTPQIELLAEQRLRVRLTLVDSVQEDAVDTLLESGFEIVNGHRVALVDPVISIDNQPVPEPLIRAFVEGISPRLTLKQLESLGVTARILQLELQPEAVDLAVFVQIAPDSELLGDS